MHIFALELRNSWKSTVLWTIALGLIIWLMLAFFPAMQSESMQAVAGAKLDSIDPALLQIFGIESLADFTQITSYFGYVLQYITIAIMVFITQTAVATLVKEETEGSIELVYSMPVTRTQIFWQKSLAILASFAMMILTLYIVTNIGYLLYSEYGLVESLQETGMFYGAVLFIGLIYFSTGLLLSSVIPSSRVGTAFVLAVVFGTLMFGIMGSLIEKLSFMMYMAPMEWVKVSKLMNEGIRPIELGIGVLVTLISMLMALFIYKKRDLRL